jgi:hypothetical protein
MENKYKIIYLTKVIARNMLCLMEANSYLDFGLEAERDAAIVLRKSRLMLASNFLVGTRFNSSRFSFASIGGSL